jgi:hypothetical protein
VKELEKGSINPRKLGSIIENKINPDEFYVLQNGVKLPFVKNTKDYQLFLTGYYDVSLNGIGNKGKKFDNIPRDYQFWYLDRVNSCYDMVNTFKVIRLIKKNGEKLTDKEIASMMLDYGIAFYDGKNKLERFINLIIVNLDNKSLYNILNKIAHYDLTEVESHYKISHTDLMSIFDTWNIEVPKKSVFAGSMSSKLIDKLEQEVFDQFNNTDYLYLKTKLLFNGTKFNKEHFYKYMKGVFANKGYKLLYFNDNTLFPFTKNYNTSSSSVIFTCSETNSNFEIIPWDDFVRKSEEERKVILTKFIDYKVAHKQNLDSFTELQKYLSLNMLTKYNWVRLFTIHGIKVPNIFRGKQLDRMYQQSSLKEMRDNLLSIVKNEHCNDYGFVISTFENCYCSYLAMECSPGLSTYRVETFSDFIRFISKDKKRYIFNNRTKNKRTVDATLLSNPANSDDKNINGITHIDLDTKEIYDEKVHKNKLLKVIINYVNDHPKEQTVRLETITE